MKSVLASVRDTQAYGEFLAESFQEHAGDREEGSIPKSEEAAASPSDSDETAKTNVDAPIDTTEIGESSTVEVDLCALLDQPARPGGLSGVPQFEIDSTVDEINKTFDRLAALLKQTGQYFHKDGKLVVVDHKNKLQVVTKGTFDSFVHPYAEFILRRGDAATFAFPPSRLVGAFVSSAQVL